MLSKKLPKLPKNKNAASHPSGRLYSSKKFHKNSLTLEAGGSKTIGLGAYSVSEPMPEFDVTFDPDMKDFIGASLERLEIPGKEKYLPMYHFHNFGETACRITIQRHKNAATS